MLDVRAAFGIVATRLVDQDAAHGLRRCRHEMARFCQCIRL
jgi:hypothetical protein